MRVPDDDFVLCRDARGTFMVYVGPVTDHHPEPAPLPSVASMAYWRSRLRPPPATNVDHQPPGCA